MSERIKKMLFERDLVASHSAWEAQQGRIAATFDTFCEGYLAAVQDIEWREAWTASKARARVMSGPDEPSPLPPTATGPHDPADRVAARHHLPPQGMR